MHDLELRAKLAGRTGHVHRAEHVLPESPADRQERIVVHDDVAVFRAGGDARAGKLAVNLAGVGVERVFDGLPLVGLLGQHDAAGDRLHIGVGQFHRDGEPAGEALEQRDVAGQGRLARADQQHAAVKLLAEGLGDFLHVGRAARIVADEKLDFVQHDHGARDLPIDRQHLADQPDELVGGDVFDHGELRPQGRAGLLQIGGEVTVGVEDGLGEDGADVQVVQFAEELLAGRLDRSLHPVEDAVLLEPHAELRLRQRLGQALGRKDDAQHRQADALAAARRQRARRGVQARRFACPACRVRAEGPAPPAEGGPGRERSCRRQSEYPPRDGGTFSTNVTCRCRRSRSPTPPAASSN